MQQIGLVSMPGEKKEWLLGFWVEQSAGGWYHFLRGGSWVDLGMWLGEGNLSILSLSLDCFSFYLHLVNLLPIFGSQFKCHFLFLFFKCHFLKKVLSSTTQFKPNFYIKYMLSWYHVFFFSSCAMLQKWTLTCCLCCFCEWGHPTSSSHQADPPADQKDMKEPSWVDPK